MRPVYTVCVKYISSSPDHPLKNAAKSFNQVSYDIFIIGVITALLLQSYNNIITPWYVFFL
jgi:hypothetical protein